MCQSQVCMETIGLQLHTYARSCAAAVASFEHSGGVRMDHADRVINETLLNSVNGLGQRTRSTNSFNDDVCHCLFIMIIPHPFFMLNEHKPFYSPRRPSIVAWFLSNEEIRSSFKKRSAEQSYIDLDY